MRKDEYMPGQSPTAAPSDGEALSYPQLLEKLRAMNAKLRGTLRLLNPIDLPPIIGDAQNECAGWIDALLREHEGAAANMNTLLDGWKKRKEQLEALERQLIGLRMKLARHESRLRSLENASPAKENPRYAIWWNDVMSLQQSVLILQKNITGKEQECNTLKKELEAVITGEHRIAQTLNERIVKARLACKEIITTRRAQQQPPLATSTGLAVQAPKPNRRRTKTERSNSHSTGNPVWFDSVTEVQRHRSRHGLPDPVFPPHKMPLVPTRPTSIQFSFGPGAKGNIAVASRGGAEKVVFVRSVASKTAQEQSRAGPDVTAEEATSWLKNHVEAYLNPSDLATVVQMDIAGTTGTLFLEQGLQAHGQESTLRDIDFNLKVVRAELKENTLSIPRKAMRALMAAEWFFLRDKIRDGGLSAVQAKKADDVESLTPEQQARYFALILDLIAAWDSTLFEVQHYREQGRLLLSPEKLTNTQTSALEIIDTFGQSLCANKHPFFSG